MKILIVIIAFVVASFSELLANEVPRLHDEYDPAKWPKAELRLSSAATLKDVFDSGLRPYRHPGLENSLLEVKHLNLKIVLGSGKRLPEIQTELVNITPFRDGEVATIEGFTPKLTLDHAREEILKWLPYGDNKRSPLEIDEYLAAVKANYLDFDDPYRGVPHGCSVLWKEPGWKTKGGGPQVIVWFRKTVSQRYPLRLHFKSTWSSNRPSKDRGSYRPHPIKPPPGYEHVDMTAPEKFGPDSAADILRSQGVDIGESTQKRRPKEPVSNRPPKEKSQPKSKLAEEKTPEPEKKSSLPWIIAGVLFVGILVLLFKVFKGKSKS